MGGIRSKPTSSLHVPEKKYRATSAPPDTCTPTCPRYPVPSADTSGSWNKLYALTLSWRHACGSLRGRAVCVRMHCTPLAGVDGVGNVRQPRYAVGQVLWSLMTPPWVYRDHCAGPGLPRFVEITITPLAASVPYSVDAEGPRTTSIDSMSSGLDRKSTRLNSSHRCISYAV